MNYHELGATGLTVSEIGLGCEGFVGQDQKFTQEMFQLAFDHGVNCMDLYSPDPELRSRIGSVIRGRRDSFVIQAHLCTVWQNGQYKATREIGEVRASRCCGFSTLRITSLIPNSPMTSGRKPMPSNNSETPKV